MTGSYSLSHVVLVHALLCRRTHGSAPAASEASRGRPYSEVGGVAGVGGDLRGPTAVPNRATTPQHLRAAIMSPRHTVVAFLSCSSTRTPSGSWTNTDEPSR